MDMPGYTDYGKMYEMNPGAFWQSQNQLGLAQQFQQSRQTQADLANQRAGLDNMFQMDTYQDRVRQGRSAADLAGYQASDAGVKNRINTATEGLQLDAAQKKIIMEASDSELKQMENLGQRWAYSLNPEEREAGTQMLKMHKDFIKLRETQAFSAGESAKQRAHQMALQKQAQDAMMARQQAIAKAKMDARGSDPGKMSTDQLRARFLAQAQAAQAAGDYELANELYKEAQYITQLRAFERPDPMAGKPDMGAITGLPENAPKPPPTNPAQQGQPTPPAAAPKMTLGQVKQMYPGKTDEQIRAAWKKKFGVDLQ